MEENKNLSKELKESPNYFICEDGYVYHLKNGKEIKCELFLNKRKRVMVRTNNGSHDLVYLMIRYFIQEYKVKLKFTYKRNKNLEIPLNKIKIYTQKELRNDELNLLVWKCKSKANNSNRRSNQFISEYDVYRVLQMYNFTCVFCGEKLNNNDWHLDHYTPLSKKGLNKLENLVASCEICNIMKGALHGDHFHKRCIKISENFLFKQENN